MTPFVCFFNIQVCIPSQKTTSPLAQRHKITPQNTAFTTADKCSTKRKYTKFFKTQQGNFVKKVNYKNPLQSTREVENELK